MPEEILPSALGAGLWEDLNEITNMIEIERIFEPKISKRKKEVLYNGWKNAVQATRSFIP